MDVLLCKPGDGVWRMRGRQSERLDDTIAWPCVPCASAACMAICCLKNRECLCMERRTGGVICRMPCVPGVCSMAFSECGRYLVQLSSEADCIHTRCTATGELLYAAPAGVFPRCMNLDQKGKLLLCAGGAAPEARLFQVPDLKAVKTIHTPHPCFAADFWREGLLLVCAAEGEDIRTAVYTLPDRAVRPRMLTELPGPPGALCVCPDGRTALLSTRAGLSKLDLQTGNLLWNCPEWALCMRTECLNDHALISDTLDGGVWICNHCRPWERQQIAAGAEAQACFLS